MHDKDHSFEQETVSNNNFMSLLTNIFCLQLCLAYATVVLCRAFPQGDLDTAPSYKKPQDGYFQYVNVPAEKEYEFGWNRGNPNHYISRYEQNKDHRFRTRVRMKLTEKQK
jgi:hypothetical protein